MILETSRLENIPHDKLCKKREFSYTLIKIYKNTHFLIVKHLRVDNKLKSLKWNEELNTFNLVL